MFHAADVESTDFELGVPKWMPIDQVRMRIPVKKRMPNGFESATEWKSTTWRGIFDEEGHEYDAAENVVWSCLK